MLLFVTDAQRCCLSLKSLSQRPGILVEGLYFFSVSFFFFFSVKFALNSLNVFFFTSPLYILHTVIQSKCSDDAAAPPVSTRTIKTLKVGIFHSVDLELGDAVSGRSDLRNKWVCFHTSENLSNVKAVFHGCCFDFTGE